MQIKIIFDVTSSAAYSSRLERRIDRYGRDAKLSLVILLCLWRRHFKTFSLLVGLQLLISVISLNKILKNSIAPHIGLFKSR